MGIRNQDEPLLTRFASRDHARFALFIVDGPFAFSVRVRAAVHRATEDAIQHAVGRAAPRDLARRRPDGQLQPVLQKPPQRLAHRPQFDTLPKYQTNGLLDATIRILLDMRRIRFEIPDRG